MVMTRGKRGDVDGWCRVQPSRCDMDSPANKPHKSSTLKTLPMAEYTLMSVGMRRGMYVQARPVGEKVVQGSPSPLRLRTPVACTCVYCMAYDD